MFEQLQIGQEYDRPQLARLWGIAGFQAFSRGVFTPKGKNTIILFVTHTKQQCLTQYEDFVDDDILRWEGEQGHRTDERIIAASEHGDAIHLFYRDRSHTRFVYHGRVILLHHQRRTDCPSKFIFEIVARAQTIESSTPVATEPGVDYDVVSTHALNAIDRRIVASSRGIAQRVFRSNVLRLWEGSCAVTGVREPRVLVAAHIKPWSKAAPQEKVDHYNGLLLVPNLDALFDEGLISFRDNGTVMISNNWSPDDQRRMHITSDTHLRQLHPESKGYLEYHRDVCFEKPERRAS